MTNVLLEIFLQIKTHVCGVNNTFLLIVFSAPYGVTEPQHEDNSSLELRWVGHVIYELLDFVDEMQCGESCENISLEFHRLSVNCVQSSVLW